MANAIHQIKATLRQWTYPAPFRIAINTTDLWAETLGIALAQALSASDDRPEPKEDQHPEPVDTPVAGTPEPGINKDFAIALCNGYFRLQKNADQLEQEGHNSKELRGIKRALRTVDDLLTEHNIRCLDLAGEPYDDGRTDFFLLGKPETMAGLKRMEIRLCERPAIWMNGQLIQQARGIVARPA